MGAMCTYYHWSNEKCQCFDQAAGAGRRDADGERARATLKTWKMLAAITTGVTNPPRRDQHGSGVA